MSKDSQPDVSAASNASAQQPEVPDVPMLWDRVDELRELVRIVAMRQDLFLDAGPVGSGWYYQPSFSWINCDARDLLDPDPDHCRGLAIHEAAHAAVTRYGDLVPRALMNEPWIPLLLNVIEDCRIEDWMRARLPGCAPWVEKYNNRIFGRAVASGRSESKVSQYSLGVLCLWWWGKLPGELTVEEVPWLTEAGSQPLDDEVVEALEQTATALEAAINSQPPTSRIDMPSVRLYYLKSPVARAFLASDSRHRPDSYEMLVRLAQFQMWAIVYQHILPVVEKLWQQDMQNPQARQSITRYVQALRAQHHGQVPPNAQQPPPGYRGDSSPWGGGGADLSQSMQDALSVDPSDKYLQNWQKMSALIDRLSQSLIRVLEVVTKTRWLNGYPTGARLDLRMAMQFEARPSLYNVLWQRKSMPRRIDPAFILLLDVSGSMGGSNIERAFEALVLLAEVSARLDVPCEIWSFSNGSRMEHAWDEALSADKRNRLGSLLQRCDGGTDMSGALKQLRGRLDEIPNRDRILLVLGDGEPNDPNATQRAVRDIEADGVATIGLGIGRETQNMGRLFNNGLFGVPVEDVAEELAEIISDALTGETNVTQKRKRRS